MRLFVLICVLLWIGASDGIAQLGMTRFAIEGKYGAPTSRNAAENLDIYIWDKWKLGVRYGKGDRIEVLAYLASGTITASEMQGILKANGGLNRWTETSTSGSLRQWKRDDLATASWAEDRPERFTVVAAPITHVAQSRASVPQSRSRQQSVAPTPVEGSAPSSNGLGGAGLVVLLLLGLSVPIGLVALAMVGMRRSKNRGERDPNWESTGPPPLPEGPPDLPAKPPVLAQLRWDEFELLVAGAYRRSGYRIEISTGEGSDDGVDIKAWDADGRFWVIQCKHRYLGDKVDVKIVRELLGAKVAHGADRAAVVTGSTFTRNALELAESSGITLVDGDRFEDWVEQLLADDPTRSWSSEDLGDELIHEGGARNPECPRCRGSMSLKGSRTDSRGVFWSCEAFPRCRGKRKAKGWFRAVS